MKRIRWYTTKWKWWAPHTDEDRLLLHIGYEAQSFGGRLVPHFWVEHHAKKLGWLAVHLDSLFRTLKDQKGLIEVSKEEWSAPDGTCFSGVDLTEEGWHQYHLLAARMRFRQTTRRYGWAFPVGAVLAAAIGALIASYPWWTP